MKKPARWELGVNFLFWDLLLGSFRELVGEHRIDPLAQCLLRKVVEGVWLAEFPAN